MTPDIPWQSGLVQLQSTWYDHVGADRGWPQGRGVGAFCSGGNQVRLLSRQIFTSIISRSKMARHCVGDIAHVTVSVGSSIFYFSQPPSTPSFLTVLRLSCFPANDTVLGDGLMANNHAALT